MAIIWTVRWQVAAARAMRTARVMTDSIVGIGSFGSPQQKREVGVRPGGSSGFGVAAEAGSLRVDLNEALYPGLFMKSRRIANWAARV